MEVDAARQRTSAPQVCFRCHQPGHYAKVCPHRFDVRAMSFEERMDLLEQLLAEADVAGAKTSEETPSEPDIPNRSATVESDFHSRNE